MKFLKGKSNLLGSPANSGGRALVPMQVISDSILRRPPSDTQYSALVNIDNSVSTYQSGAIRDILDSIPGFIEQMCSDYAIRASVLMAWGTFSEESPLKLSGPFTSVDELSAPDFGPFGGTPLNARIIASVKLLSAGRRIVENVLHVDQGRATLIEMTDGGLHDSNLDAEARKAIQVTAVENKIDVHLFAVGPEVDEEYLASLVQPGNRVQKLTKNTDFAALFKWLHNSMRIKSQSIAGQEPELPQFDEYMKRMV